ncbi:tetratricopeptide repeat protein [Arenibaculum pallidiluteum]|uniref:tetratricopeptide repeat protein n=1 Tax=Arenibaculum pallidiluteum TaxID=2812559 RepID=UPI001A95D261|nr:tetratricopeptide repeat protein [Arenibaculum pallidiluteum]
MTVLAPELRSQLAEALELRRGGRIGVARSMVEALSAAWPGNAIVHHLLGTIAHEDGDTQAAIASLERAVALGPDDPEAHYNLGVCRQAAGDTPGAVAAYDRALGIRPDHVRALHARGNALAALGRSDDARADYERALATDPGDEAAAVNLASQLFAEGRYAEMEAICRATLLRCPESAKLHQNLGVALTRMQRWPEATAALAEAARLDPANAEILLNHAAALNGAKDTAGAIRMYQNALALAPDRAAAWTALGNTLQALGNMAEAVAAYQSALARDPAVAETLSALATALRCQGRLDEAIAVQRRAAALAPEDASVASALLFLMNCMPELPAIAVTRAHGLWGSRQESLPRPAARARMPGDRLRIGFVSADLREHSVSHFLEPLLRGTDRNRFALHCFSVNEAADAVTARLRSLSDAWHDAAGLGDEALASRIREAGIDVLVDLNGHTPGNRLRTFALRPAPVLASWLGYANTTGLPAMDYRIVDAVTDPPGSEAFATERLLRLPGCFLCYSPPEDAPEVTPPPSSAAITLGSFNDLAKINGQVVGAWAAIMRAEPRARLLLKSGPLRDVEARIRLLRAFADAGVEAHRIETVPWLPSKRDHLALYGRIDLCLDTFPYAGTTTTCESLWMGVPVLTLAGDSHVARVGASLLGTLGLTDLVATDLDDYKARALALMAERPRLAALRTELRPRFAASPLTDAAGFAERMGEAFTTMWRETAAGPATSHAAPLPLRRQT